MKSKDVLKLLGITRITLMSYVKKGIISTKKLHNGYYDYSDEDVHKIAGKKNKINVIYTRVSTYKQKDDLERQKKLLNEYCKNNNISVYKTFSEISSGIDLEREQFNDMLNEIFKHNVDKVIISEKDRLTRLSFITLQNIFKQFGTTIIVASNNNKNNTIDQELFDELISMMHYFSTKKYSNRKNKKINI